MVLDTDLARPASHAPMERSWQPSWLLAPPLISQKSPAWSCFHQRVFAPLADSTNSEPLIGTIIHVHNPRALKVEKSAVSVAAPQGQKSQLTCSPATNLPPAHSF